MFEQNFAVWEWRGRAAGSLLIDVQSRRLLVVLGVALTLLHVHQAATGDQARKPVWRLERCDPSQIDFVECRQLCEFRR